MKLISVFLLAALCALGADLSGKWNATTRGPDGDMQLTFTFKVADGKITGMAEGPMGQMPITEGKLDGDNISFTVETDQFKVTHKGTVTGDDMKLKVEIGDQVMDMTAKRSKA